MPNIKQLLSELPDDQKQMFIPVFGSVDRFYSTVYLITRNEHVTDQEKPERYEDRLQVIREVKKRIERLLDSFGLDGEGIVADISSDYFEDYVNYKDFEPGMTNEEFVSIIRQIPHLR